MLRLNLCVLLCERCDPKEKTLIMASKVIRLCVTNIVQHYWSQDGGIPIIFEGNWEAIGGLKKICSFDPKRSIPKKVIKRLIEQYRDRRTRFRQAHILYVVHTILGPPASVYISKDWLNVVVDVTSIQQLNWASWSFKYLMDDTSEWKYIYIKKKG